MTDQDDPDRRFAVVPPGKGGKRLDVFLAEHFSHYSRRRLKRVVKAGLVLVNGNRARAGWMIKSGDRLELPVMSRAIESLSAERAKAFAASRQQRAVVELHRDEELLIVSKPSGVPVHGGAGIYGETLIDLLRDDVLAGFGLVHRLDVDTTGAIALVRTAELRKVCVARFADPAGGVRKTYDAIVSGIPEPRSGDIEVPLTRPGHGGRARVDLRAGRPAHTRYTTVEEFEDVSRVELEPLTGRTHQLRAHLAELGTPLLVDPLYGTRKSWKRRDPRGLLPARLKRTPLHARGLTMPHPRTGADVTVRAPLPDDMRYALEILRTIAGQA